MLLYIVQIVWLCIACTAWCAVEKEVKRSDEWELNVFKEHRPWENIFKRDNGSLGDRMTHCALVSPAHFISYGLQGMALWNREQGIIEKSITWDAQGARSVVVMSPRRIAVCHTINDSTQLDIHRGDLSLWRSIKFPEYTTITKIAFLSENQLLMSGKSRKRSDAAEMSRGEHFIGRVTIDPSQMAYFAQHMGEVTALCALPDKFRFVSGGFDSSISFWDIRKKPVLHYMQKGVHDYPIDSIIALDDNYVVSADAMSIVMWNALNPRKSVQSGQILRWNSPLVRISSTVIATTVMNTIVFWDARAGSLLDTSIANAHASANITSLVYAAENNALISCSGEDGIKIWKQYPLIIWPEWVYSRMRERSKQIVIDDQDFYPQKEDQIQFYVDEYDSDPKYANWMYVMMMLSARSKAAVSADKKPIQSLLQELGLLQWKRKQWAKAKEDQRKFDAAKKERLKNDEKQEQPKKEEYSWESWPVASKSGIVLSHVGVPIERRKRFILKAASSAVSP